MYQLSRVLDDYQWVYNRWILKIQCLPFSFFGYFCPSLITPKTLYKIRRTWYKISKIARIKSAHLQPDHHFIASHTQHPPPTRPTLPKLLTLTMTPNSLRTQLYRHSVAVGLVDWQRTHPNRHCHPLIADWFINREAGRQRCVLIEAHLWAT